MSKGQSESAPSVACSIAGNECLVPWVDGSGGTDLRARRVDLAGKPLGPIFDVSVTDGVFEAFPTLAFSKSEPASIIEINLRWPSTDTFFAGNTAAQPPLIPMIWSPPGENSARRSRTCGCSNGLSLC